MKRAAWNWLLLLVLAPGAIPAVEGTTAPIIEEEAERAVDPAPKTAAQAPATPARPAPRRIPRVEPALPDVETAWITRLHQRSPSA